MADILVKPPEIKMAANDLRKDAADIQRCVDNVDGIIKGLGPSRFEGTRADNLRQRYSRLRDQIYSFKPLIDKFAREFDDAADRFTAADKL